MNFFRLFILIVLFFKVTNFTLISKDTVFVFPNKPSGKIYPTYQRLNIWDLTHTKKFPAYPHHRYHFLREANLMTTTGGRQTNEFYDKNGNHDFSFLGKSIQNLLDSGLRPIIVIGNTPGSLSDMPDENGAFNANIGKPKNYKKYYDYISSLFDYLAKTFPSRINDFHFRLYTEPDFYVWFNNGLEEYKKLYDVTLAAMREGLKNPNNNQILHPGNFMAPTMLSDTSSMFYPWSIAIAKWLKEDYKNNFVENFDLDLTKWEVQGKAKIINSELVISEGKVFSKIASDWTNYNLIFNSKYAGKDQAKALLGVLLNFKDDNNYILIKFSFGDKSILSVTQKKEGKIIDLEIKELNISSFRDYKFEINSFIDTIKIKINDIPILSVNVQFYGGGKIGFFNENGQNDIIIDNIIGCKYHYVSNFNDVVDWKIKGKHHAGKNAMILSDAEAILNDNMPKNYKLNFKMKTDTSGEEGSDVAWLIFDYEDSNNYSAFILNYHGYTEYKKIVNGQEIIKKSSWTGLPKPYFYGNFTELPEDFIYNNLRTGKMEKGVLKLKNDSYIVGNSNPLFCYEYRIRAKLKIETNNSNTNGNNLIVFNYSDSLNYWGIKIRNNDSLILIRKLNGRDKVIISAISHWKAGEFNDFDLRIGGDITTDGDREVWNRIENHLSLVLNGKKIISGVFDVNQTYGKVAFVSNDDKSSMFIQDYLITHEGDSRGISPLDWHNFEFINDDFVKILSIDGITYAVVYDSKSSSNGKIGFKANNSRGVHISKLSVSDIVPYDAGALPRIPKDSSPRFSYSYYAQLQTNGDYQIGIEPKDIKILTEELKKDLSPFFNEAKIEVAEASIYLDEEGLKLDCSDGTELGSAWNAAVYKYSLDVGLEAFTQWGYTSEELRSPTYNLFEILENMQGSTRISVTNPINNTIQNFDGIATKKQDSVFILIYNFNPDRHSAKSGIKFLLKINDLIANQNFKLEESRIDSENSNFFNKWLEYCKELKISPKPGKSRYDMNIAGAYDEKIIENHWKKQKAFYKVQGDDLIKTYKSDISSRETGNIIIPLEIPGNGIIFLKIYPNQ